MPGMSETPNAARQVSDEPSPRRLLSPGRSTRAGSGTSSATVSSSTTTATPLVRDYIDHPGAVAVLPMNDDGEVLLIKQYRHPVGMDLWEIPAGLLDVEGEDFVVGAARELAEEADLVAGQLERAGGLLQLPGSSSEAIRIYLARGLSEVPGPRAARPHGRGSRNRTALDPAGRGRAGGAGGAPAQPVRRRRGPGRRGRPGGRFPGPPPGRRALARPSQPALMTEPLIGEPAGPGASGPGGRPARPSARPPGAR